MCSSDLREERGEALPAVPQPTPEVLPEKVGPQLSKTGPRSRRWVAGLAIASAIRVAADRPGQRIGVVLCGGNIGADTWCGLVNRR